MSESVNERMMMMMIMMMMMMTMIAILSLYGGNDGVADFNASTLKRSKRVCAGGRDEH